MSPLQKLSLGFAGFVALCALVAWFLHWIRYGKGRAYDAVRFHVDNEHPDRTGYYIASFDPDGTVYDSVGPYRTRAEAERIMHDHPIEDC